MSAPLDRLVTSRLVLRRWTGADREPFARMNADPRVMRYFPRPLLPRESDRLVDRFEQGFSARGFGIWALERRDDSSFIGFTGLQPSPADVPCDGLVEVGWRLAAEHWHQGFATEAGAACLAAGFEVVGLGAICSFTAALNRPSLAVMHRLGLDRWRTFDHPRVATASGLRPHVAYRLEAVAWSTMGRPHAPPPLTTEEKR